MDDFFWLAMSWKLVYDARVVIGYLTVKVMVWIYVREIAIFFEEDFMKKVIKATEKTTAAKTGEKAVKAVTETVKEAAKKVEEVAADTKKAVKTTAASTATKTAVKKAAVKETVYLQYMGKEINKEDLMKQVKEIWTKQLKNKAGDMKSVTLYLKPEENKAYYVINDDVTGSVEL